MSAEWNLSSVDEPDENGSVLATFESSFATLDLDILMTDGMPPVVYRMTVETLGRNLVSTDLRDVPVARLVRQALASFFAFEPVEIDGQMRASQLPVIARIYRDAVSAGLMPVERVVQSTGASHRTVSNWVSRARKAGLIEVSS